MAGPDPINGQNPIETRFFRVMDGTRTGLVHIHDGFVKRCDFSFDAPRERPDGQPAPVMLDDARVLALHHNQLRPAGDVQDHNGQRVGSAETVSHLALIGSDPWRADEPVRRVSFFCPDADPLFVHAGKQRRIVQAGSLSADDLRLFHVPVGGETYGATHIVHQGKNSPVCTMDGIRFWIEFSEGCPLDLIRQRLTRYLSFLSFLCNRRVAPCSVRMGKTSDAAQAEHEVVWSWSATEAQGEPCPVYAAPFAAQDDQDLAALAEGLSCWIKRLDDWEDAYRCLTACLGSTEEMFSESMLNAWRWFERLPDTGERKVLDPLAIKPLADAAFAVAQEQGLDISRKRIDGSLRTLCKEGFEQRVRRLVAFAMQGTDIGGIGTEMAKDISAGREIRGAAAHGNLAKPRQQAAIQRVRSTYATKAFCFLWTARELPLTPGRRGRLSHHPPVAEYIRLLATNRTSLP